MIDRIVVFILDRESADLFCKIRLNCQNAVSERMLKLIAQIFKICVVAADGIVLELPAAVIELHDARAVNGFFDVKTVKKERGLRVLIGAHVSTAAGGQAEQPHPQACRDEERFELHSITSAFFANNRILPLQIGAGAGFHINSQKDAAIPGTSCC